VRAASTGRALEARQRIASGLEHFDRVADGALEHARGWPVLDHTMQVASAVGDWSVVWHLVGAGWGLTSARRAQGAVRLSVLLAAESIVVNQGVKRLFRRVRPTETGDPRYPVRRPTTSSFPSGHASAAFFAATLLTEADPALAPIWFGLAAVVTLSRPYVRIHHMSDVAGGAAVGLALAAVAKRIWPE
jgi:undecaprenyl-diphosphatase